MVNKQEIEFIKITNINQAVGKNKLYCLKLPSENTFSLIVTDLNGVQVPLKDLTTPFTGVQTITNPDGNLQIFGANNVSINISTSLLATINSALQAGDNISNLVNDAGYLTTSDLADTKVEFNTQLTDGDFIFVGDITQYTNEQAQDAVGTILVDTPTIDLTYNDVANQISASVKPNSITSTELANNINISEFINNESFIDHTDLSTTQNPTNVIINSDVGTDATINLADGASAGVTENNFTDAEKLKLSTDLTEITSTGGTITVTPSTTTRNIEVVQATESQLGGGEIVTQVVIEDETTTNDTDTVTAKKFWQGWLKGLTLSSFFTAVRGTILTGFSLAYTRITSSDTILTAFGKTQGQIDDLLSTTVTSFSHNVNLGDNQKFDFTVSGVIRNPTSGLVTTLINQVFTAQSVTHNANGVTYFGVKEDMTLTQQSTRFTTEQRYNHLCEWAVIYNPLTFVIITFNDFPNTSEQLAQQFHNYMKNSGVRNLGNNQYTNFGTTILNIYKPIGGVVEGVGWGNLDADNPNEKNMAAISSADTFNIKISTGDYLTGQTLIDPTIVELSGGGVVTTLPNPNDVTVYRITFFNSNLTRVQIGQTIYSSVDEAIARTVAKSDPYTTEQNISDNGLTVTYLAIQKNCTAWSQTTRYRFFPAPQSGNASSATFVTFNSIYNSIVSPHLILTDSKGSFDYKSDMVSNLSKIIRGYDNTNTEKWYISADGTSSWLQKSILDYTDATLPLNATDKIPIYQAGTWKKVDKSELNKEFLITNASVSGTYNIDWNAGGVWRLTLVGPTTLTFSNLPSSGFTDTKTLNIDGDETLSYPSGFTGFITGEYSGTATLNTITVQVIGVNEYKVVIVQPD